MHNTKPFILHTQLESCTKLYVHRLTVVLSKLSLETASCIPVVMNSLCIQELTPLP